MPMLIVIKKLWHRELGSSLNAWENQNNIIKDVISFFAKNKNHVNSKRKENCSKKDSISMRNSRSKNWIK